MAVKVQGFLLLDVLIGCAIVSVFVHLIVGLDVQLTTWTNRLITLENEMISAVNDIQTELKNLKDADGESIKLCTQKIEGGNLYYLCQK